MFFFIVKYPVKHDRQYEHVMSIILSNIILIHNIIPMIIPMFLKN